MRNSDEKLKDIFRGILMLPQVKETCYNSIVNTAVPIIVERIDRESPFSTEEVLENFYAMEDPSELQEFINIIIGAFGDFKLSQEACNDVIDIVNRELDKEP